MKKTMTVNIGGRAYHIDEDAYNKLNNYLEEVRAELNNTEGESEIYDDIEHRIGELFTEKLRNNRQVIVMQDVEEVIRTMGNPADISGRSDERNKKSGRSSYRRMYRDPENRIVGGVCSGLAAYWQLDTMLVRIIFILLSIFGMAGVIIYLILWIILPEASSVAQKLEMRGEPVNLSNIGEFFRKEFENVKKSFSRK
jgi:phage shock protein PspC (stress-responsive transcriptional regulator)